MYFFFGANRVHNIEQGLYAIRKPHFKIKSVMTLYMLAMNKAFSLFNKI